MLQRKERKRQMPHGPKVRAALRKLGGEFQYYEFMLAGGGSYLTLSSMQHYGLVDIIGDPAPYHMARYRLTEKGREWLDAHTIGLTVSKGPREASRRIDSSHLQR